MSIVETTINEPRSEYLLLLDRIIVLWKERKNPVTINSIWRRKTHDDFIIVTGVGKMIISYQYLDSDMFHFHLKKIELFRFWERVDKWQK